MMMWSTYENSLSSLKTSLLVSGLIPRPSSFAFSLFTVDQIFEALSTCAALHPDPNLSSDEEMEDADVFLHVDQPGTTPFEVFTGDEGQELSEVGRVRSDFITDSTRFRPY
jgi:hypothetical protein